MGVRDILLAIKVNGIVSTGQILSGVVSDLLSFYTILRLQRTLHTSHSTLLKANKEILCTDIWKNYATHITFTSCYPNPSFYPESSFFQGFKEMNVFSSPSHSPHTLNIYVKKKKKGVCVWGLPMLKEGPDLTYSKHSEAPVSRNCVGTGKKKMI